VTPAGRRLTGAVVTAALALLFWGCASEGDPFARNAPVSALSITAVNPQSGATGVSPETLVTIGFPLDVDPRTVSKDTVHLLDFHLQDQLPLEEKNKRPLVVPVRVLYDAGRRVVTVTPDEPLPENGRFQVVLQDVRATNGVVFNALVSQFFTGPSNRVAPQVLSIVPVSGQALVPNTSPVVITLSKPMDQASLLNAFSVAPGIPGTSAFSGVNQTVLTFTPGSPYPAGALIIVTVRQDARDTSGVPLERSFSSTFTVEPPPRVLPDFTIPPDRSAGNPVNTPVTVVFSAVMQTQTVADAFTLSFGSTFLGQTDGTFTFVSSTTNTTATFLSTAPLPPSTSVQIRIDGRARSLRNVGLDPLFIAVFQTAP
jgi:hypothetical protein